MEVHEISGHDLCNFVPDMGGSGEKYSEEIKRRLIAMDNMVIKPEVDIDFTDNGSGTTLWYVKLNDYLLGDGSPNKGDIKMEAIRIAHALGVIPLFHLPDALIKEVDKV